MMSIDSDRAKPGEPRDRNITYIGRWDTSGDSVATSHYAGAYLKTEVCGSVLRVHIAKPAGIAVIIDDQDEVLLRRVSGMIDLAPQGLSPGWHRLRIIANHDDDEIAFAGLELGSGGRSRSAAVSPHLIEFIGDSITLGGRTSRSTSTSYPRLTADGLGCELTQIAYSGIALADGYAYDYPGAPRQGMESQYAQAVQPNSPATARAWDFTRYSPSIIVVNLGTNDWMLRVPESLFRNRMESFLSRIRTAHPSSKIVVMGPVMGYYHESIASVVASASDSQLSFLDTSGWICAADTVDGEHPGDEGHRKISRHLIPHLDQLLNRPR